MTIVNHYPENTKQTLYLESGYGTTVEDLLERIREHFGDVNFADLKITSEKIHTRCITYDLYDGADWDDYIIISKE
ncbi:hypothetical protein [Caulobacter phage Cr30]|uniref:hypothetical protein n=1 Tax=Caulobacter phage Cr30 TaxID=1357714 RepID=UPI0004A9BB48|nr:hypothetical protein OZ74_gp217 [Caulobacter phage Cr30]AGS81126.1 hypothetical protein [Caulobacter phage Cr30]